MDYATELRKRDGHRPLILPGAVAIMVKEKNEVLQQHRKDGGWGLPGGLMESGESMEETARREVKEETGLEVGELKLLGVFSDQDFHFKLLDGDELYSVTAVYKTDQLSGELIPDFAESVDLRFFGMEHLPAGFSKEYRVYLSSYSKEALATQSQKIAEGASCDTE